MALHAYVKGDFKCPHCGSHLYSEAAFQWGFCPARTSIDEHIYRIGDKIKWRVCSDRTIPTWSYFGKSGISGANIGEPRFKNVRVRDDYYFYKSVCDSCHLMIGGLMIQIENEVITDATVYKEGEFSDEIVYYVLNHGIWEPKPEWDQHPVNYVLEC